MPDDRPVQDAPQDTRWLTDREQAAWRAYILSSLRLTALLDREMQHRADLPMSYYEILAILSEAPDRSLRMSELAEATHSLPSRITHAVGRLEKAGWVTRRNCLSDRRAWYAELTGAGLKVVEATAPIHVEGVRRHLIDQLDGQDLDDLLRIFGKVKAHLDEPWSSCAQAAQNAPASECPSEGAGDELASACLSADAEDEQDEEDVLASACPSGDGDC